MLALGADRVLLRAGSVLNPHYRTMGLYGSEYWTYVLPRRVGARTARVLTEGALPVGDAEARRIGLADELLAGDPGGFASAAAGYARRLAGSAEHPVAPAAKRAARDRDERRRPLRAYRRNELVLMSEDIHADRHGFHAARRAFLDTTSRALATRYGMPG